MRLGYTSTEYDQQNMLMQWALRAGAVPVLIDLIEFGRKSVTSSHKSLESDYAERVHVSSWVWKGGHPNERSLQDSRSAALY